MSRLISGFGVLGVGLAYVLIVVAIEVMPWVIVIAAVLAFTGVLK